MRFLVLCITVAVLCSGSIREGEHAENMGRYAEYMGNTPDSVIYEGTGLGPQRRAVAEAAQKQAEARGYRNPSSIVELKPIPTKHPTARLTRTVKGVASWYCKKGVSVCHYAYPPGSMVAAACLKLRKAMGPDWRGTKVVVTRIVDGKAGGSVPVKLVDWCGSTTKLIDLYWEPMRRLGGSGTLPVVVRW